MKVPFVDLYTQYLTIRDEIDLAISNTIKESAFIRSVEIDKFEENFSNALGLKYCISCGNGTDALYLAMRALDLGPGDEVITTAQSWISTSETITQTGARVVFCDVNPNDYLLDVSKVQSLITKNTKGIIPVHLYGQSVDMDPLIEIANANDLWILEDCAQAHFAKYKQKFVGTFGDAATFSFYPGKNLGAMGDAGAVVTNRKDLAEYMRLFARHGGKGEHLIEGINSRMDGIQAAILNVKMKYIERWTDMRRKAAENYTNLLKDVTEITAPRQNTDNKHVYHLYVIKCKFRNELKKYLGEMGIQTSVNYNKALPYYKAYQYLGHSSLDFPNSYANQETILSLPIYPEISHQAQHYIIEQISNFLKK